MRGFKKIAAVILVICISLNLNLFSVYATNNDTQPPVVTSISVDKHVVTAGDTVTITIGISDDSKIPLGRVGMTALLGGSLASTMYTDELVDNGDGTYSCQLDIVKRDYNGDYYFDYIILTDSAGNVLEKSYPDTGSPNPTYPDAGFTIIDCEHDLEPPVVQTASVDNLTVTAGDTVTITVAATDENIIAKGTVIVSIDGVGASIKGIVLSSNGNGTYSGKLDITASSINGDYNLSYISLTDSLGNEMDAFCSATDYPNTKFKVINCVDDIFPPVVNTVSIDKHIVTVGDTVTITVAASDDHKITSGTGNVTMAIAGTTGGSMFTFLTANADGTFSGKFKIQPYTTNGEYYFRHIELYDSLGNGLGTTYLKTAYPDVKFTVYSELNAPIIDTSSLSVSAPKVSIGETERVYFNASDASGIKDGFVTYLTPTTKEEKTYPCTYDAINSRYFAEIPFGDYAQSGKWILKSITVNDKLISTANIISSEVNTTGVDTVNLSAGDFEVFFKKGDITQDNKIDIFDILAIQRYILGVSTLTENELSAADVTGEHEVDIYDILKIQRYILGIENL